jgi:penicillin-binding protein 1A
LAWGQQVTSVFSKFQGLWTAISQGASPSSEAASLHQDLAQAEAVGVAKTPERSVSKTRRSPRPRRPLYFRPLFWLVLLAGSTVAGASNRAYRVWRATEADLPEVSRILTFEQRGTITIRAADGSVLQKLGPATREKITYDNIPPDLIQAFVAAEDQRFYEHNGVDYQAIARATLANLRNRDVVEGASTITQQLARIVFLDQERSFQRKAREALIALKIQDEYDKSIVMERYLNLVYLGPEPMGLPMPLGFTLAKPLMNLPCRSRP